MSKLIALKPRLSEKGYGLSVALNTYIFQINAGENKHTIARAVTQQYKVNVTGVHIAATSGKAKRTYKKRSRSFVNSHRSGVRKAYVTLAEGDKLPIYAATEADNTKPAKETK